MNHSTNGFDSKEKSIIAIPKSVPLSKTSVFAFTTMIITFVLYTSFLLWIFTPVEYLQSIGITYYPQKYSALALTSFIIVFYVCICAMYIGFNLSSTNYPNSMDTITDYHIHMIDEINMSHNNLSSFNGKDGIPDIYDIHPQLISQNYLQESDFIETNISM